jgi:argininosuccinate lyase
MEVFVCRKHGFSDYPRLSFQFCSGACVRLAEEQKISIDTLTLQQLQEIDPRFDADVMKVWDYEVSVERKSSTGGTAMSSVIKQIDDMIAFAHKL